MNNIVITSGQLHNDLDVLACAFAYKELLLTEGAAAEAILTGPLNKSVTNEIKGWGAKYLTNAENLRPETSFVIVDISEPKNIAKFVNQDKIIEIYDHHFGFEEYWRQKTGIRQVIEKVGACATLIFEEWEKRNVISAMSTLSARLLYTAIVSNTLYFKAKVTDQRDIKAADKLIIKANLGPHFVETYFQDQEAETKKDPEKALRNDTIPVEYPNLPFSIRIGQLELWNSAEFIKNNLSAAEKVLGQEDNHWFLTSPSISEGQNYLYAKDKEVKKLLEQILSVRFDGDLAKTSSLILRKEIKKKLLEFSGEKLVE